MKNILFALFLIGISLNISAQERRSSRFGNDEIVLSKSGVLELQNERKYRGYLVKLTNTESKLAIGYKGGVQVWDTAAGSYKLCLGDEARTYNDLALSQNGEYLAGYREKKIFVWETASCRVVTSIEVDKDLNSNGLAISSNGKYLFYVHDASRLFRKREKIILWDIERGVEIGDLQPEKLPIFPSGYDPLFSKDALRRPTADFSPDSKLLAVQYSYRIYLWDVETGKAVHRFVDSSLADEMSHVAIYDIHFIRDGSHLVTRGADGRVRLWDVEKNELVQTFVIRDRVHGRATLRKDNKYLAAGGITGEISIWDVATGEILWKGARKNYFPSFSDPEVGLVSVESGDIYDLKTGQKLEGINGEFLSDGKLMVKEKDGNYSTWLVERN